jgi:ATP-dependent DNA helicase RecQ
VIRSQDQLAILREVFGFTDFRGQQAEVIRHVIAGGDAFVLMPTGAGKSMCFQIPAMVRSGVGVVVSPLIALMQDQVRAMQLLGVRAAFLNSTLDPQAANAVEHQLLDGELELLYVAPERLLTPRMLALLERSNLALFAIDEAHCVSQWGHDFREDYLKLSVLHERFPNVPRIALTATADKLTRVEIVNRLQLQEAGVFVSAFDRPNIRYRVVPKANSREQLWNFIETEHPRDSGIVYCLARKSTEAVAEKLCERGRIALPYHAGMPAGERQRNLERFLREDGIIVVATIAFGMGIDKPDVRFVAHLDLPKSIEAYYQETGRAGRDGEKADAFMTYGVGDVERMRGFIEQSEADAAHKVIERQRLEALVGLCETAACRRQVMLGYFGDTIPGPCGNCDTCLTPQQTHDCTAAACKALQCALQTGERFGAVYLTEVLIGKPSQRARELQHDKLAVFGSGAELGMDDWRSIFRQLVALRLLEADAQRYGGLKLTELGQEALQGNRTVMLRRETTQRQPRVRPKRVSFASSQPGDFEGASGLFDVLRQLRRELAQEAEVPPFVIFHDTVLKEMARLRPTDCDQLSAINGVGVVKLERYGADFLAAIRKYTDE